VFEGPSFLGSTAVLSLDEASPITLGFSSRISEVLLRWDLCFTTCIGGLVQDKPGVQQAC
jgi:hypothetical protein